MKMTKILSGEAIKGLYKMIPEEVHRRYFRKQLEVMTVDDIKKYEEMFTRYYTIQKKLGR